MHAFAIDFNPFGLIAAERLRFGVFAAPEGRTPVSRQGTNGTLLAAGKGFVVWLREHDECRA